MVRRCTRHRLLPCQGADGNTFPDTVESETEKENVRFDQDHLLLHLSTYHYRDFPNISSLIEPNDDDDYYYY